MSFVLSARQALLNRGKIHRSMGNFDAARADFDAILSMKAGHKAASQVSCQNPSLLTIRCGQMVNPQPQPPPTR